MKNSKLITLLQSFSSKEWKAFGKYLQSPYLNSNKRLVVFYAYLKKHHPAFGHKRLEKPIVFDALFPKKEKFDDRLLRATMADLHKAAESFLVFEKLKKEERLRSKLLVQSYSERGLYSRFERSTNDLTEKINALPSKSMADYLDTFLLNRDHYFHPQTEALTVAPYMLKNAVEQLDAFYALAKLRLSCELSARQKIVAEKTGYPMLGPVCGYVEKHLLDKDPAFGIYLDLLKINMEGLTEELFFALKNKYLAARNKLSFLEQKEVLVYLINYAYRLNQSQQSHLFKEHFELYKFGLKNALLFENGVLPELRFTNIAIVAASAKEWKWTEKFIAQYSSTLPENFADDAVLLAKAFLFFFKKKYFKADELLNKITNNKIDYRLRVYSLSIRCLYEISILQTDYEDVLLARIQAYEKYLNRQKIFSKPRIAANLNFFKLIKKITFLTSDESRTNAQDWKKLKLEIESKSPLVLRQWLLLKVKERTGL